jgi:hypothetical protein
MVNCSGDVDICKGVGQAASCKGVGGDFLDDAEGGKGTKDAAFERLVKTCSQLGERDFANT